MKRYVFLFIFGFSSLLSSAPYKLYPILFVHGYRAGSGTWGAPCYFSHYSVKNQLKFSKYSVYSCNFSY